MTRPQRTSQPTRLRALVRLRWIAIGSQLAVIAAVKVALGIELALGPLGAIVAAGALSNVGLQAWLSRSETTRSSALTGVVLGVDVLLLTGLLHVSGGPLNPFTFLYLVHVVLAAVLLEARGAGALAALSVAAYGALFLIAPEAGGHHDHHGHHGHHGGGGHDAGAMELHLRGMWAAYTVTAAFVVGFVAAMRRALAEIEHELELAREAQRRQERLSSLATLAAGAAHELSTPLSTIALVSRELELALERSGAEADLVEDAGLMRDQVARCQHILQQMSAKAGQTMGEAPEAFALCDLVRGLEARGVEVRCDDDVELVGPRGSLQTALGGLVKNARDAADERGLPVDVHVHARLEGRRVVVTVRDASGGIPEEALERVGEPFYTTKSPGAGMGLGVFLARELARRLGGDLAMSNHDGGARATFTFDATPS